MTILVDAINRDLAVVILRPNLLEKLVLRQREQERYARRIGGRWCWEYGGGYVSDAVERAIVEASP